MISGPMDGLIAEKQIYWRWDMPMESRKEPRKSFLMEHAIGDSLAMPIIRKILPTVILFRKDNFILFNLAVGGNFPAIWDIGQITALDNGPAEMEIDYVRVFQKP